MKSRRSLKIARVAAITACIAILGAAAFSEPVFAAAAKTPLRPPPPPPGAARGGMNVDVALVIAIDVSGSVDDEEAHLQRKGVADAFFTKEVVQAIRSGTYGRIAVTSVDFSSRFYDKVIVDWRVISDQKSAADFAGILMRTPRTYGHGTSISDAIELGEKLHESNPFKAAKRVIDISGDGPNNFGRPITEVRAEALAKGIVINGLPVMEEDGYGAPSDLDKYYSSCVIGGPGSFVQVAKGFDDFSRAIRRKLVLELSSNMPPRNAAPAGGFIKIAQTLPQRAPLARPRTPIPPLSSQTDYPPGCDYPGYGFFP